MDKDSAAQWKKTIWLGFVFFGMIGFIFYSQNKNIESLKLNGIRTIGTIVAFGSKNSIHWVHKFQDDDVKIIDNNQHFLGLQLGEQFEATFDPNYPVNARIHLSNPIINFSSDTIYNYDIINGPIDDSNIYVSYSYKYEGKEYTRQQVLPDNESWENIPSFKIVLNKSNPQIAYLIPTVTTSEEEI